VKTNPARKIVVIIRDEPIAEIVASFLRMEGYECDVVWEQKAILRVIKQLEDYNLVFCQVAVLEDEEKLLTWALEARRDIPIVACAARNRERIPNAIYERCKFLQVPFEREQLLATVREAMNSSKLS
jgi:DNA-binding NtrC family response regulator